MGKSNSRIMDFRSPAPPAAGVVRCWSALNDLREDGLPPPDKVREGGSPGEHAWIEHPDTEALEERKAELKARANAFRLAVGAKVDFLFSRAGRGWWSVPNLSSTALCWHGDVEVCLLLRG